MARRRHARGSRLHPIGSTRQRAAGSRREVAAARPHEWITYGAQNGSRLIGRRRRLPVAGASIAAAYRHGRTRGLLGLGRLRTDDHQVLITTGHGTADWRIDVDRGRPRDFPARIAAADERSPAPVAVFLSVARSRSGRVLCGSIRARLGTRPTNQAQEVQDRR